MKEYKIRVIDTKTDIFVCGWLTVYKNYYLIIDEDDLSHRFPISKTIIHELKQK